MLSDVGCCRATGGTTAAPRTEAALPPKAVRARVATPRVARHVILWMGRFILRLQFFVVLLDVGIVESVGINVFIDVVGMEQLMTCRASFFMLARGYN